MSLINEAFVNALLADAAYAANLVDGLSGPALRSVLESRMTASLAQYISQTFSVVTTIDTPDDIAGPGFDATVWRRISDGKLFVSMRGTEGTADILTDVDLALSGSATRQLVAMVNWWLRHTTPMGGPAAQIALSPPPLPGGDPNAPTTYFALAPSVAGSGKLIGATAVSVNGHSLGGHLASAFHRLFGTNGVVEHTRTFNSAGFTGGSEAVFRELENLLGIGMQRYANGSEQTNYFAAHGVNFTTNTFWFGQIGTRVAVFNEEGLGPANHSMYKLTDALTLFSAMSTLAPDLTLEQCGAITEATASAAAASLEGLLDALRRTLTGRNISPTPIGDVAGSASTREAYHSNLKALTDGAGFQSIAGKLTIALMSSRAAPSLAVSARTDFGQFLALETLSAFVISSKANVVDAQAALSSLWQTAHGQDYLAWQADQTARLTGDPNKDFDFTDEWYEDRAALLTAVLKRNEIDASGGLIRLAAQPPDIATVFTYYADGAESTLVAESTRRTPGVREQWVKFADDAGRALVGSDVNLLGDRLHGGAGDDTLAGFAGPDYLEGNGGADVLRGGRGADRLRGGNGADRLYGDEHDDTLIGGLGDDRLEGGAGFDTYVVGAGQDTILDADRDGVLKRPDGRVLAGAFVQQGAEYVFAADVRITATRDSALTITLENGAKVVIEAFDPGDLGLDLVDTPQDTPTARTILGDFTPLDADPAEPGIQIQADDLGNPVLSGTAEPGRADSVVDSSGPDLVQVGGGNDTVLATRGGADTIEAGSGRDTVRAGDGDDLVEAGGDTDIVSGGAGKDRLYGDSRIDLAAAIAAGAGVGTGQRGDWLTGGAGDDIVIGGAGNDALFGGEGEDLLIGGGGGDVLNGDDDYLATSFDWTITPDAPPLFDALYTPVDVLTPPPYAGGADIIYAGAGNDFASGLFGDDVISGEAGEDVLSGDDGNDTLIGGADNDRITGDYGALVYASGQTVVQGDDLLDGGAGDDWLQGEAGEDLIFGGDGSDQLYGDAAYLPIAQHGADYLEGEAGVDFLFGQGGDDTLLGGTEGDFLWGDAGADLLEGGAGEDYLEGGSGADTLYGGTETDSLFGNAGQDLLDGGDGDDLLNAGEDADTLIGGPGADTLIGGAGDDTYFANLAEGDRIIDDEGDNRIVLIGTPNSTGIIAGAATVGGQSGVLLKSDAAATTGIFVQGGSTLLEASNPTYEFADGTAITHSELMQTAFTETLTLTGTSVGDALKGYAGADLIQGLAGDDWLSGGAADDVLEGGEGDDELIGGAGADTLRGGLGNDTYTVDAEDTVEEFADEGTDTVLADSSYTLGANLENLTLTGEAAIDGTGNALENTLTGNDAANVLTGLGGADALFGGGGADTLEGGLGDDALAGGTGDDEYLLSLGDGADTIEDASGLNSIRFGTGIEASSLTVSQFVGDDGATYLRLGYGTGGDSVAIRDGLLGRIGAYRFADATVRTHEDILASLGALAVQGTGGSDTIVGGANADVLDGAAGTDQLFGRGADDLLRGGDGDDTLWGEAGNDVLDGGAGADTLTGGTGEDTYLVTWGMGEDTIVEDPGGSNRLRLGTAVAFEDLAADRVDEDLVLSLRAGSNRLTIAGYYAAAQDWLVTDSASESRTLAEVIAQSPSGPPDPVEAEIAAYRTRVLREFYSTQNFSVLGDGALDRSFSRVTGTESNSTHSTYVLQDVVQASDDGYISRGSLSVDEQVETTVTESTMTVYVTQPGSRAVADGLAAHGAANNVSWRYVPIGDFSGRVQIPGEAVFVRSATQSPDGSNDIVGMWMPESGSGGSTVTVPTLSVPVAQTVTITNYFTEQTLTLNLEEIRAGESDNFIQTTDYSVVDAGAGNDFVIVSDVPSYVLPDGPGNRGVIGSLLYGNDGDDSLSGGYGNDLLIGGAGFDQLYGGSGADTYLAAGEGRDSIADSGEDLDRYRAAYYTVANFPDLWLRERRGGQYYDAVEAEFYRVDDGTIPWNSPDVNVAFYDSPDSALAEILGGLESGIRRLREDSAALLRSGLLTDGNGRTAGDIAREIRTLEAQIGIEQARGLARFVYVEPLPPLPQIAGNDYAAIEPYYGDTVWVDTVVLDEGWSFSNLMVSTSVFDGEAETLYLERPDGAGVTIALARGTDPIGTGIERFAFADGSAYTIRQILDLENQDRTITGTDGDDSLTGGRGDDTLIGLAGADYLYGRLGDDSLQGGEGSDYYDYDGGADVIEDFDPTGADFDGVYFIGLTPDQVTTTFDGGTLRFEFTATDSLSIRWDRAAGYGVEEVAFDDGTIWDQAMLDSLAAPPLTIITGTSAAETLTGTHGRDEISGLAGDDVLLGLGGADRLDGGAGADQMSGGAGDDTYVVNDAGDQVLENPDEGVDTVEASLSFTLPAEVENLTLTGGGNLTGTGNALANVLTGNNGANTLDGGDGDDTLAGGPGADTLLGGAGDDTLLVAGDEGSDTFDGGSGFDTVLGSAGDDVIRVANLSATNGVERIDGGDGVNTLAGTAGNNTIDLSGIEVLNIALIDGGAGSDAVTGSSGADTIQGGAGADTLAGGEGDDTFLVTGDEGPDTFDGGAGFDTVLGSAGDDVIRASSLSAANNIERIDGGDGVNAIAGTAGNNTIDLSAIALANIALIDGGAGNDTITGTAGADAIQGGAGSDTLLGGAGDDTFLVTGDEGPDTFDGGAGFDTILGSAGDDVIRVSGFSSANGVERIDGGGGVNSIAGTAGNNTIDLSSVEVLNVALIDGGAGDDTITGTATSDAIQGGAGADTLFGGAGDDTFLVAGDEGPDTFDGGSGFDTVLGSAGDDVIRVASLSAANNVERIDGAGGVNTIAGTAGNNTIDLSAMELLNIALIDGGTGNDTITGTAGADLIQGGAGSDSLLGGGGDDTFLVTGDEGPDTFDGGSGFDTVLGSTGDDVIRVSGFGPANGVEKIDGAGGYNLIAGTAGNNTIDLSATQLVAIALIDGGAGSDTITGSAGHDTILGGTGADTLRGGAGDDTFLISGTDSAADAAGGDGGFDAILGSAGDDTFRFSSYGGTNSVERIDGAGGVDTIAGTAGNNTLDFSATELLAVGKIDGGAGNDTVTGSAGSDSIAGGDGTDTLRGEGGNDLVQGGLGNDTLVETAGTNLLDGGAGTDAITGGAGAEFIAGGTGNDTVNPGAGADVLAFNTGDGQDTVNPGTGANKTLSLGGGIRYEDLAFRKSANDLIVETSATEQVTLKNWYAAPANQGFVTLQVIAEAMAGYSQSSPDPLRDDKVETFNFGALVSTFDAARAADPMISRWAMMNALLDAHLAGSDDAALGGDLAYQYGMTGTLAGIGTGAAQDVLGSSQFGTQAQQLRPLATLQEGAVKLG